MTFTYHNNFSPFWDEHLQSIGWTPAHETDVATFGMWSNFTDSGKVSKIGLYKASEIHILNDKISFYKHLLQQDPSILVGIPETYITWEEVKDLSEDDRLWFLKKGQSMQGKDVWPYRNLQELAIYATKPGIMDHYLIQREVPNPFLIVGYKFTLRVYVLIFREEIYIYRRYFGKIHPTPYDRTSLDRNIHVECTDVEKIRTFECFTWEYDNKVWEGLKPLAKRILTTFLPLLNREGQESRFTLFGFDCLVDKEFRPWLLEVNPYPHLWDKNEVIADIKRNVIRDMFGLMVNPVLGKESVLGHFEKL